ncbi:probable calcium-binding protein CML46 [Primulina eburnea]|uniref:probable calcium-binding protein CML46 n=1 Tax=Primulina eburnea TaxID=1245227 RepID=UPI003C6C55AB
MSLDNISQFPIENISLSLNSKILQFTLIVGLVFKFLLVAFLDKKRMHSFVLGLFKSGVRSQVLPEDSKSKKLSVEKQKRVDPILRRGDVEIVLGSLGLISDPEEARLDTESHEIFSLFEEKNPSPDELKDAFDVFDRNGDGFIDSEDLQKVICSLGLDKGLEMESFERMIDVFDDNGDGRLDFEEFVKFLEYSSLR